MHQLALQEQHIAFMLVYGRLKKQQRRQAKYPNKNAKEVQIQVGHWSDYMNVDALTKKTRSVAQVRQRKVKTLVNALVDMF